MTDENTEKRENYQPVDKVRPSIILSFFFLLQLI